MEDLFPAARFPAAAKVHEIGDPLDGYPNYDPKARRRVVIDPYEDEADALMFEEARMWRGFGPIPLQDGALSVEKGADLLERVNEEDPSQGGALSVEVDAEATARVTEEMSQAEPLRVIPEASPLTLPSISESSRTLRPHVSDPLEPTTYPAQRKHKANIDAVEVD